MALKTVQYEQPKRDSQISRVTSVSHATRDVPLPQYLVVAPAIASPSVAKQLAAISGIPVELTLRAYENNTTLILGGAETQQLAQTQMERYANVPITLGIREKRGAFGHQGIRMGMMGSMLGGLALTVLGLGWIPLGIGTGIWAKGTVLQSREQTHNAQMWKDLKRLVSKAARGLCYYSRPKRVLTSDLPSLAIKDLITQIDTPMTVHNKVLNKQDMTTKFMSYLETLIQTSVSIPNRRFSQLFYTAESVDYCERR